MSFTDFFSTDAGKTILTFLISMVPIFECRAAIPTGVACGLPAAVVFVVSALGNIRKIFDWLRRKNARLEKFVARMEARAEGKAKKIRNYSAIGLILFVGVPLPGTGAWTGAFIAAMLGLKMRHALPAISLGVIIACVLVMFLSLGAKAAIQLL